MRARLILLAGAALVASPAAAQTTAIVPDAVGSAMAAGTTVHTAGSVTTIDGGTLAGTNLFHSFATFNLAAGDTAHWTTTLTDPARVTNVINRVTGGTASQIGGTLDSTDLPNAAFFFINPAGIVFGKDAVVNVPGAAWFSTGKTLNFADGSVFSATTPSGSTFSIAAPQSFGFLGQEGDIALQGTTALMANPASAVGLVGANLSIADAGVAASRAMLAAVGDQSAAIALDGSETGNPGGVIAMTGSSLAIDAGSDGAVIVRGGQIGLDGSKVTTKGGGAILISGGALSLGGRSLILVSDKAGANAGDIAIGVGDLSISGTSIVRSITEGAADAGEVAVEVKTLRMQDNAEISSLTFGSGNAGGVAIKAGAAVLDGAARIFSDSTAPVSCADVSCIATGNAGKVELAMGSLRLLGDAVISSSTFGSGAAGELTISADTLDLSDSGRILSDSTYIPACQEASCSATGSAGDIVITSHDMHMSGVSLISSNTFGAGDAGKLMIKADTADLSETARIQSNSTHFPGCGDSACSATGNAGSILLNARILHMRDHAVVSSDTYGSGNAGGVLIEADTVDLSGHASVSSDSAQTDACTDASCSATGNAGAIALTARQLVMSDWAYISSDTYGAGKAGQLAIKADSADLSGDSSISSDALSARDCSDASCVTSGNASDIALQIKDLQMRGSAQISSDTYGSGKAGSIELEGEVIHLSDDAGISSNSGSFARCSGDFCQASGDAGNISLKASRIRLDGLSSVASDTSGTGHGGAIQIKAGTFELADTGSVTTDSFDMGDCSAATCRKAGDGGDISITSDKLSMSDTSVISSVTAGSGDAGNIFIKTADLRMSGFAQVLSDTFGQASRAGAISVMADTALLRDNAMIRSGSSPLLDCAEPSCRLSGEAGVIKLKTGSLTLTGSAMVSTTTEGTGNAGSILIETHDLKMIGGQISSKSTGCSDGVCSGGRSGEIAITAQTIGMSGAAEITTLSASSAQAGDIAIIAPRITITGPASMASTNAGTAPTADGVPSAASVLAFAAPSAPFRAGSVSLSTTRLTVAEGGSISTNSTSGPAGIITIAMPQNGGILTLSGKRAPGVITTSSGPGTGGQIMIASPLAIISNGGSILAKGQAAGADVQINSRYFIQSADRPNVIAVDGSILIQSNLYDVSAGTAPPSLEFLDASRVLLGQCASVRATGEASRISWRNTGPYAFLALRGGALALGATGLPDMPPC